MILSYTKFEVLTVIVLDERRDRFIPDYIVTYHKTEVLIIYYI